MPNQQNDDDDGDRHTQQPKKYTLAHETAPELFQVSKMECRDAIGHHYGVRHARFIEALSAARLTVRFE